MNLKNIKRNKALKFLRKQGKITNNNANVSKKEIKKVGVLADENLFKTYDFRKKLAENFGIKTDDFTIILYQNVKNVTLSQEFETFSDKDFGMGGKIKGTVVQNFVQTKFDLLINYCAYENVMAQVASYHSKAILKAGFNSEELNFYDISIQIDANKVDTFNAELTKYLQILKLIK
jgi:hypothetical protein